MNKKLRVKQLEGKKWRKQENTTDFVQGQAKSVKNNHINNKKVCNNDLSFGSNRNSNEKMGIGIRKVFTNLKNGADGRNFTKMARLAYCFT